MQTGRWKVLANRDQLEKAGLMNDSWQSVKSELPNRVHASFESQSDAIDVYQLLKNMGLVAFRNWF